MTDPSYLLDLDDPDIRDMANWNHRPEEVPINMNGIIQGARAKCQFCYHPYPCPTRLRLRQAGVVL